MEPELSFDSDSGQTECTYTGAAGATVSDPLASHQQYPMGYEFSMGIQEGRV